MDATPPQVTVAITRETAAALDRSGYFLYAFAGVRSSDAAARPLVWMRTRQYAMSTRIRWTPRCEAYTAAGAGPPEPGAVVEPSFQAALEPGQTLRVDQPTGGGAVADRGSAGALSILNATRAPLTCGVSRETEGAFRPVCALPLYGGGLQVVAPRESLLLLFSTLPAPPGTVADVSTGPGVWVDLEGAAEREVEFDLDAGWSWGEEKWGRAVPAQSELAPLLVEPFEHPPRWSPGS